MCGRYVIAQKIEVIEKRFNVTVPLIAHYEPSYNISVGQNAPVITDANPREVQMFCFGLSPHWSEKRLYLFNARTEGDRNKDDDPNYTGGKDIIVKPAFRKAIRQQRCLVLADCIIEGTSNEGLDKAYVVYLRNHVRPFAMAGIWDVWHDKSTGNDILGFAILTTTANSLLQMLPHRRSPVILTPRQEKTWLHTDAPLTDITAILQPYPAELMNAYPISSDIKNIHNNDINLLTPIGERLIAENESNVTNYLKKTGMGNPWKR